MSVVREFYANLASHVLKKVRVRGILIDFSAESINSFYSLDHVPSEPFNRLYEHPDYPEVIRVLTNGRGEWKINSAGHVVYFKAKHLAFIPKVWHHFITSRLIPTTNVCEVTAKRAMLNYPIIQDIPFDVGQVIEDAILHNRDAKMNLGHPFLIFGLCKRAEVPLDDNEAWLQSEPHFGHRDVWVGGRVSKGSGFCIYVLLSFCSSPFCDVQWLAGSPFYKVVILYSLLFQNLGPFLQQKFLWFCLTCGLKN